MPNHKPLQQNANVKATFEDQPDLVTHLTIQANGQRETHRLIHELESAGYLFEKQPSVEEMERSIKKQFHDLKFQNAGRKLLRAKDAGGLLRLAAKYILFRLR